MPTFLMFTLKTQWCLLCLLMECVLCHVTWQVQHLVRHGQVHVHVSPCMWSTCDPCVRLLFTHVCVAMMCHACDAHVNHVCAHVMHMWIMSVHMWCTCDAHVLALSSWRLKLQASIYIKWPAESLDVARRSGMTLWSLPTCIQSPSWRPRPGYQQIKRL